MHATRKPTPYFWLGLRFRFGLAHVLHGLVWVYILNRDRDRDRDRKGEDKEKDKDKDN